MRNDAAGASLGQVKAMDAFTLVPLPWEPGQTLSLSLRMATAVPPTYRCPAGTYTVIVTFGPFRSAPATFALTP